MTSFTLAILFSLPGFVLAADCPANGNNCARAVTGTAFSQQAARRADCSTFQRCVVTPATSTTTTTVIRTPSAVLTTVTDTIVTVTVTPTPAKKRAALELAEERLRRDAEAYPRQERRQNVDVQQVNRATTNCPTAVPAYAASVCTTGGTSVAYASACSCAGVTKSYTTLSTPTTTRRVTSTATTPTIVVHITPTSTVLTSASTPTPSVFIIRAGETGTDYLENRDMGPGGDTYIYYGDFGSFDFAQSAADRFSLVNGILNTAFNDAEPVTYDPSAARSYIYEDRPATGLMASFGPYDSVAMGYPLLLQLGAGQTLQQDAGNTLYAATAGQGDLTPAPALYAIAAT